MPNDGKFIIKSKLSVSDIGFVKIDQNVDVKLAGSHSSMFRPLKGKIKTISPDSINDQNSTPYYQIFIELKESKFLSETQEFKILPGLEVICSVVIAKRNLIENILAPFKSIIDNSFRENIWFESKINKTLANHFLAMFSVNNF